LKSDDDDDIFQISFGKLVEKNINKKGEKEEINLIPSRAM